MGQKPRCFWAYLWGGWPVGGPETGSPGPFSPKLWATSRNPSGLSRWSCSPHLSAISNPARSARGAPDRYQIRSLRPFVPDVRRPISLRCTTSFLSC